MRWEDESYVRVYTRDTAEWLALGWEAQSLFVALLRKVDRAGILVTGRTGLRGVSGVTGFPLEVVERAMPILLEDGCVQRGDGAFLVPGFVAAQETPKSDVARKREQRERDRAKLAATINGQKSQNVTLASQNVTGGHTESRAVTIGHSVLDCAALGSAQKEDPASAGSEPSGSGPSPAATEARPQSQPAPELETDPTPDAAAVDPGPVSDPQPKGPQLALVTAEAPLTGPPPADRVFAAYLEGWRRNSKGNRPPKFDDKRRRLVGNRLRERFTTEELEQAARGIWLSVWHVDEHQTSFELAMRDSEHVEKFRDIAEHPELGRRDTRAGVTRSTLQQPAGAGDFDWKENARKQEHF